MSTANEREPGWTCVHFKAYRISSKNKKLSRYLKPEDTIVFSDIQSNTAEPFFTLLQNTGILKDELVIAESVPAITTGFKKFGDLKKAFKWAVGKKIDRFLTKKHPARQVIFLGDVVCGAPPYKKKFSPQTPYDPLCDTFLVDLMIFNIVIHLARSRKLYFVMGNHDLLFYFRVKEVLAALKKEVACTPANQATLEQYQLYRKYLKLLENARNFVEKNILLVHFDPTDGFLFTHSAIPRTLINLLFSFFMEGSHISPQLLHYAIEQMNQEARAFLKNESVFSGSSYREGLRRAGIFVRDFHADTFPDDIVNFFSRWVDTAVARAIFNATNSGFHKALESQYDHRSLMILALFGGKIIFRGHDTFSITQKSTSRSQPRADLFAEASMIVVGLHSSERLCTALLKERAGILVESLSAKDMQDRVYYYLETWETIMSKMKTGMLDEAASRKVIAGYRRSEVDQDVDLMVAKIKKRL